MAEEERLNMITWAGAGTAALACIVATMALIGYRMLRTTKAYFTSSLLMVLGLSEIIFLAGMRYTDVPAVCTVVAFCLHYLVVACFAWLLNFSLFLAQQMLAGSKEPGLQPALYLFLGWVVPLLVVIIAAVSRYQDYRIPTYCWISEHNYLYLSLLLPAAFIAMMNVLVLISTAIGYFRRKSYLTGEERIRYLAIQKLSRHSLLDCILLLPLLSVIWSVGTFMVYYPKLYLQVIFCVSNVILGGLIFLRFCIFSKDLKQARKGNKVTPYQASYTVPRTYQVQARHGSKSRVVPMVPSTSEPAEGHSHPPESHAVVDQEPQSHEAENEGDNMLVEEEMEQSTSSEEGNKLAKGQPSTAETTATAETLA